MNNVNLIGRLVKDPELRRTTTGTAVVNFTVAVDGGREETFFFPIIAWKELGETIVKYVFKGHKIAISGRLTQRSYEKDGRKNQIIEVVAERVDFLEPKGETKKADEVDNQPDDRDDDMPF